MSDEANCPPRFPGGRYCPESRFQCTNHLCVAMSDLCDGKKICWIPNRLMCKLQQKLIKYFLFFFIGTDDCGDASDEAAAVCSNFNCDTLRRFQCDNHRCIARYQICDGVDNCGDGSDENNMTLCAAKQKPCDSINQFKCANKKCIDRKNVCDFSNDCMSSFIISFIQNSYKLEHF